MILTKLEPNINETLISTTRF